MASNVGTWMHEVADAWLMTTLTPSPLMVALLQTAEALPIFLLALPSGALADVVDRRKLLLLTHAFESLDCIAVEFRTHFFNHASRRGIERLGAKLDGILRNHQRASDGTLRDTCVYSIIASEWPTVKAHLTYQLARPRETKP